MLAEKITQPIVAEKRKISRIRILYNRKRVKERPASPESLPQ
jgi:hypothetical protein